MKAFIAITLLAACVAGQTFDYQTGGLRQHLLKKELGLNNGMWKDVDTTYNTINGVDTYNTVNGVDNILTLEELIRHPLFQTYYTLPLFRQHFTHPLFQVYLTTPYFQKFWTHPVFPTFFRSTHLFNKFIYPVVYNTVPTTGVEYDREFDMGLNNIVGEHKNFPLNVNHVQYGHVMDKIFKHLLVNNPEVLEVKTDVKIQKTPVETTFVKRVDPITGQVKYVVDEYKNVENTVLPVEVVNTIRKPIETVYGNDYYNTINKPYGVDTVYGNELMKNAILKKIWLNKIIRGDRVIPEMYNLNKYEQTVYPREHMNTIDTTYDTELIKNALLKKIWLNKVIYGDRVDRVIPEMYNLNKYESVYPRDIFNHHNVYPRESIFSRYPVHKYESLYPRDLVNKYETVLPREFVNKYETVLPREFVNKYETVLPREFVNKYETVLPREFVNNKYETVLPREFVNNKYENIYPREQLINKYETVYPRHLVNKYETENKLENILKTIVA